jgi:hypothetical protein
MNGKYSNFSQCLKNAHQRYIFKITVKTLFICLLYQNIYTE